MAFWNAFLVFSCHVHTRPVCLASEKKLPSKSSHKVCDFHNFTMPQALNVGVGPDENQAEKQVVGLLSRAG